MQIEDGGCQPTEWDVASDIRCGPPAMVALQQDDKFKHHEHVANRSSGRRQKGTRWLSDTLFLLGRLEHEPIVRVRAMP